MTKQVVFHCDKCGENFVGDAGRFYFCDCGEMMRETTVEFKY